MRQSTDYERAVLTVRDHLGEESEWAQGRALTADQTLTTGEQAIQPQHSQQNQHPLK
jgi:hypothetical protein